MILGTGVDIVDVARVERMLKRWGARFLRHLLTVGEQRYVRRQGRPAEHVAARIAAKEAVLKAFGDSHDGSLTWRTIEVIRDRRGHPGVRLLGRARSLLSKGGPEGWRELHVSLTHTHAQAVASAILVALNGAASVNRCHGRRAL